MTDSQLQLEVMVDGTTCGVEQSWPRLLEFEHPSNPQLAAEGWERRFMADSARMAEYVELYRGLGYEVRTEKVAPEEIGPECGDCRLLICRQFVTLYTRKWPPTADRK